MRPVTPHFSPSGSSHWQAVLPPRRAFTLTELLVVITIIGMLAGMALGALYTARQTARVQRTKATITKLDRIVQERYMEFASRRLPFPANVKSTPGNQPLPRAQRTRFFLEARLRGIRQIQKWEMPDKLEDLAGPMGPSDNPFVMAEIDAPWEYTYSSSGQDWTVSMKRTALCRTMFRKQATRLSTPEGSPDESPEANADVAELLYMWITTGDREVIEQFQAHEVGDTDGDGYSEFLDAWGEPIRFIRSPASFAPESDLMTGDPETDHDPFDSRGIDPDAFSLVPLIFSKGPDKKSGLDVDTGITLYDEVFAGTKAFGRPVTDPDDEEYECHFDNIHNHSLGMN